MSTRRAALDGLARIMEATALEDLFTGTDDEASLMLDLLSEASRGREASCYWEVCRTARRRGVTPEYVGDRASVLLASIEERRRSDVYRLLGVPPLADAEVIRHRWLEIAKREHPDVGGDAERFRRAKDAYELLKDGTRRAEYERYWLRALGPFERVATARQAIPTAAPVTPAPPELPREPPPAAARVETPVAPASLSERVAEIRGLLARIRSAELERARGEVAARIDALEGIKADLAMVARLRRAVGALAIGPEETGASLGSPS
jgi:hypothetical protein